jgi:pyruvate carboxylase subunit B
MGAIGIMDTILRDAHQSLLATRMRIEDMTPVLRLIDRVGFWSVEMWGGATFDACIRYLGENPWERLRIMRREMPNTRLQMLLRGQNIVGYRHYADDVVDAFVERAAGEGIDVFRVFDALNDVSNLRRSIEAVKRAGKIAEGAMSYTVSPVHTIESYVELGQTLREMGCDLLCIKDMAGQISPKDAHDLVKGLVDEVGLPVHVHCHATSGMAEAAYYECARAGAAVIDGAISALAGGTSQPPTETLVAMFRDTPYDTGLDLELLGEIATHFREARKRYGRFESSFTGVDTRVLTYQIPGGMISNLANQLREQDALDKMGDVLEEVPRVRADLGYPPLVTPSSQIVGTQATFNVLTGQRYATVTRETRLYCLGKYGRPPAPLNPDVVELAIGDETPVEGRAADLLEPELPAAEERLGDRCEGIEDVITAAIFPQLTETYLKIRDTGGEDPDRLLAALAAVAFDVRERNTRVVDNGPATGGVNPWKLAGRWEITRARG